MTTQTKKEVFCRARTNTLKLDFSLSLQDVSTKDGHCVKTTVEEFRLNIHTPCNPILVRHLGTPLQMDNEIALQHPFAVSLCVHTPCRELSHTYFVKSYLPLLKALFRLHLPSFETVSMDDRKNCHGTFVTTSTSCRGYLGHAQSNV